MVLFCFFFQAEDGIRDLVRSRGLGDVYKRQSDGNVIIGKALMSASSGDIVPLLLHAAGDADALPLYFADVTVSTSELLALNTCLLYTSDAADERSSVDLGGRRIIKKKKTKSKKEKKITLQVPTQQNDIQIT